MAQDWSLKQQAFVTRFSTEVVLFLASADKLNFLCKEFTENAYGGTGTSALTDTTVQLVLPASTALEVAEAQGALAGTNQILDMVSAQRGYLENMRP